MNEISWEEVSAYLIHVSLNLEFLEEYKRNKSGGKLYASGREFCERKFLDSEMKDHGKILMVSKYFSCF